MKENPLIQLKALGQSVWLDFIQRSFVESGELKRLIDNDGLSGLTSNPTIFAKAISETNEYDREIEELLRADKSIEEIYLVLAVRDIRNAADMFYPTFERTKGEDGFVSLEVSPHLARDTNATIEEARNLFALVNRENVMIKIPATHEGLAAIEQAIAEGININVTLIFSLERYEQVVYAYVSGLERRGEKGEPLDKVRSVASVFVSRIDSKADKLLAAKGSGSLQGKVAIANSRLIYAKFKEIFGSERFKLLQEKGANLQRPLWGSTGTKNPAYSDVLYVEELIGPHTVNTMPPATLAAFRDHGKVRASLQENVDEAAWTLKQVSEAGISLKQVTDELESEGVNSFSDSFEGLFRIIEQKR